MKCALTLFSLSIVVMSVGSADASDALTYTRDVAPIMNAKCVQCHRPDQGAPMSLRTFKEVRPWGKAIEKYVSQRLMPPWHADPSVGEFKNDRSLTQEEIDTIVTWIRQGMERGDKSDLPEPVKFPKGEWKLGEPDYIVEFKEVSVPASGEDQFENLIGRVMLKEDKWVKAIEFLPGNTKVVHHVIAFSVRGFNPSLQEGWLGGWAAGLDPMVFPEGTARLFKAGSNIIGDMHYHPAETDETDITRVGLHFADEDEIEKQLMNIWVANEGFEIPPGAPNHEVRSSYTFMQSGKILGLTPHMHYRGKDFTYTAHYPDGREEELLRVNNYDFNWQTQYMPLNDIAVTEGTRIECVAHFDNSANNLFNPDPTKTVTFGDESYDEMMIGFVDFVVDDGLRPESAEETRTRLMERISAEHPGEVFGMYSDRSDSRSPFYLPREGDGIMVLSVNGTVTLCPVFDVKWTGSKFEAGVDIPNLGKFTIDGEVDESGRSLEATLHVKEQHVPIKAELPN